MAVLTRIDTSAPDERVFEVSSPATGAKIGRYTVASTRAVHEAIERARTAQAVWAKLSHKERLPYFMRALKILSDRQDHFVDVIVSETGRSRLETLFMEIFPACDSLNYFSRRAKKMLKPRRAGLHLLRMKRAKVFYKPLGVVGVIAPWNGPFILSLNPTVQALAAGNAVIVKPSEVTPFSGKLVEELFQEAGFPEGLVQVVLGDGQTGQALIDGGVNKISFTGSVATGRKVGASCGENLIPCSLELGGKDPMIVCSDANLERAANGAVFGGFVNNGQFCCGIERVYVVDSVADAFLEKLAQKTRALSVGGEEIFDVGPFIMERQIDIVDRHVQDALDKGAKALVGGRRCSESGRLYYEPTVLVDVTHDMAIMTEETFGPVLPVMRCRDEEHAIELANDSKYGLSGSVWTRNKSKGQAIATRIDTGSVCVNETGIVYGALEVPFGGTKQSGVGSVHGANALRNYCTAQPVVTDRFGLKKEAVWFPYTQKTLDGLKKALRVMWSWPMRWFLK